MLAKKYRLPIQSVLSKKGVTRKGRYFLVKVFPAVTTHSRVGVVVSAKVAAQATTRNNLKRRIYDAAMLLLPSLPPHDYEIICLIGAEQVPARDAIIKELQTILAQ